MLYSRWKGEGGFDYFETPERRNLGDDLPVPQLPGSAGGIGVPAQECGRPVPSGARRVGHGDIPQGLMAPASAGGAVSGAMQGSDTPFSKTPAGSFCVGLLVGGIFGYVWWHRRA